METGVYSLYLTVYFKLLPMRRLLLQRAVGIVDSKRYASGEHGVGRVIARPFVGEYPTLPELPIDMIIHWLLH